MIGAPAFLYVGRRSVKQADAVEGQLERVGGNLHHDRLEALPHGGGADIDGDRAVVLQDHAGVLTRTRGAALDEACDSEAVIEAVDQPALEVDRKSTSPNSSK